MDEIEGQNNNMREEKSGFFKVFMYHLESSYWRIRSNLSLFLGLVLVVSGLLSFKSGRYCDGNTSDYYTCTNPTTYYEYSSLTILFVTLGSVFLALWFIKKSESR